MVDDPDDSFDSVLIHNAAVVVVVAPESRMNLFSLYDRSLQVLSLRRQFRFPARKGVVLVRSTDFRLCVVFRSDVASNLWYSRALSKQSVPTHEQILRLKRGTNQKTDQASRWGERTNATRRRGYQVLTSSPPPVGIHEYMLSGITGSYFLVATGEPGLHNHYHTIYTTAVP
jgi:hypothetical protein